MSIRFRGSFTLLLVVGICLSACSAARPPAASEQYNRDFFRADYSNDERSAHRPYGNYGRESGFQNISYLDEADSKADSDRDVSTSPKNPWGDFALDQTPSEEAHHPWWSQVLLWIPNRVLDVVDVFRLDAGAGMSFGGVVRLTRYGQVGYRSVAPLSVRLGAFGRRMPVLIEHSSEFGIGPAFVQSNDRKVCKGEIGLGLDLFLVGAYGGVCVDEALDFLAGVFFLDPMGDDLK